MECVCGCTTVHTRFYFLFPCFPANSFSSLLPSCFTIARARFASPPFPLPHYQLYTSTFPQPHVHFYSLYLFQLFITLSPHTFHHSTLTTPSSLTLHSLFLRPPLTLCLYLNSGIPLVSMPNCSGNETALIDPSSDLYLMRVSFYMQLEAPKLESQGRLNLMA